jgi:alpha-glucosidase (family GH31 glycosyl hydrolase)
MFVSENVDDNVSLGCYFPRARWYDFYSGEEDANVTNGTEELIDIPSSFETIPVHVRLL